VDEKSMQLEREIKKKETELRRLKKSHQYPKLPVINAITIFAREQVKNCQRSPGLGSSVGFDIKEVYKQCHRDWKSMTQSEKAIYKDKANQNQREYDENLELWCDVYIEQSFIRQKMETLKSDIVTLKKRKIKM
jgi:GTPase SAR1 family protein